MNKKQFSETLFEAFNSNGLGDKLDEKKAEKLFQFAQILVETNKSFNLTAITEENDIILKHFADCATALDHLPNGASIIDVGCGAGFPSIPIAILREDVNVTALDSTAKRIGFINDVTKELSLNNICGVAGRAEDFAKTKRENFDVSISRAVARLNILSELCLPLTKIGGKFIAMKSSKGEEELSESKKGIGLLGGRLSEKQIIELSLNTMKIEREIYVFEKASKTPIQYPRNYSQISKKPL